MLLDNTNLHPPWLRPGFPSYPALIEVLRVTGKVYGASSSAISSSSSGVSSSANLYTAFLQQSIKPIGLRDRIPVYLLEPNGAQLPNNLYLLARLVDNYNGLPLYSTGCCCGDGETATTETVTLTGNTNNLAIGVGIQFLLVSLTTNSILTGLMVLVSGSSSSATGTTPPNGTQITITNVSSTYSLTLANQSTSSSPGNQIQTTTGQNQVLPPLASATLTYYTSLGYWLVTDTTATQQATTTVATQQINLSTNTNNLATPTATQIFANATAPITVTGIVAPSPAQAQTFTWTNIGTANLTLANQSASSATANQFTTATGANVVIVPGQQVSFIYNPTSLTWYVTPVPTAQNASVGTQSATIGSNTNNFAVTASQVLANVTAASNLTGMVPPSSTVPSVVTITNLPSSTNTLTIPNQSASSSTGNQFQTASGSNLSLTPGNSATFTYNPTTGYWLQTATTAGGSSGVTGSGTANYIPKWTGSTALGNSALSDDGTTVTSTETISTNFGSGTYNVRIGLNAGNNSATGNTNVCLGGYCGASLTSGYSNMIQGYGAGQYLTSGYYNAFVGSLAGNNTTTAPYNTFIGASAGYTNVSGQENTGIGASALYNYTGSNATAVGYGAGYDGGGAASAARVCYFGYRADNPYGYNDVISLGVNAYPFAAKQCVINMSNAAGDSPTLVLSGATSTAQVRTVALTSAFTVTTNASFATQGSLTADDYAASRTCFAFGANGSAATISWFGATQVVQQSGDLATALGSSGYNLVLSATLATTSLTGTITNAQLANSSITINGVSVPLGSSANIGSSTLFGNLQGAMVPASA